MNALVSFCILYNVNCTVTTVSACVRLKLFMVIQQNNPQYILEIFRPCVLVNVFTVIVRSLGHWVCFIYCMCICIESMEQILQG